MSIELILVEFQERRCRQATRLALVVLGDYAIRHSPRYFDRISRITNGLTHW
jgi:hypothetical protein